ncbi:MAG: aspartate carbamoyltransferase catalytic subunit [Pseudomonadota bacterium]
MDAWEDILDPGEEILWQGRPEPGAAIGVEGIFAIPFGVFFAGFSVFWMTMAAQAGGYFWTFGLLFFAVGCGLVWNAIFGKAFRNKRTFYTLTNRRAFIAKDLPFKGKTLKSYPLTGDVPLEWVEGHYPSVHFATDRVRTKNGYHERSVGFERIADGTEVYRLIRGIQRGDHKA